MNNFRHPQSFFPNPKNSDKQKIINGLILLAYRHQVNEFLEIYRILLNGISLFVVSGRPPSFAEILILL